MHKLLPLRFVAALVALFASLLTLPAQMQSAQAPDQ